MCGEEVDVLNFPVDETSNEGVKTTKAETIHFSRNMRLARCPACDPEFDGEKLELVYPEVDEE